MRPAQRAGPQRRHTWLIRGQRTVSLARAAATAATTGGEGKNANEHSTGIMTTRLKKPEAPLRKERETQSQMGA